MEAPHVRTTYHHGNLKSALIEAAIALIEEKGPEVVTVAEAGKRAGVSSGAPFRHFENKIALMTAVAEVFQFELIERMQKAHDQAADPRSAVYQMGMEFANWGIEQPMHFRTYSNRNLFDFESSPILIAGDLHLAVLVIGTFEKLHPSGPEFTLRSRRLYVDSRALLTGLVTLYCNGQFRRFGLEEEPHETMERSWDLFLQAVLTEARPLKPQKSAL